MFVVTLLISNVSFKILMYLVAVIMVSNRLILLLSQGLYLVFLGKLVLKTSKLICIFKLRKRSLAFLLVFFVF